MINFSNNNKVNTRSSYSPPSQPLAHEVFPPANYNNDRQNEQRHHSWKKPVPEKKDEHEMNTFTSPVTIQENKKPRSTSSLWNTISKRFSTDRRLNPKELSATELNSESIIHHGKYESDSESSIQQLPSRETSYAEVNIEILQFCQEEDKEQQIEPTELTKIITEGSPEAKEVWPNLGEISCTEGNPFEETEIDTDIDLVAKETEFENLLLDLLDTGKYSNFTIKTKEKEHHLHKCIISVRCEKLLNYNELDVPSDAFYLFCRFLYCNYFQGSSTPQEKLIHLYYLAELLDQYELRIHCEQTLISSMTTDNVFDIIADCATLGLQKMIDWAVWYIGSNKVSPSRDAVAKLTPHLNELTKIITQLAHLTLSPPQISTVKSKPLRDTLEQLCSTGINSDCTILIQDQTYKVHSCILGMKWLYFSKYLHKDEVVHETRMPCKTFKNLLSYFYTGSKKHLDLDDSTWILSCAELYLLSDNTSLLQYCLKVIDLRVNEENWVYALQLALDADNSVLEKKALSVMPKSTDPSAVVTLLLHVIKEQRKTLLGLNEQPQQIVNDKITNSDNSLV